MLNVLLALVVASPQNDLPAAVLLGEPDLLLLQRLLAVLQPGHSLVHPHAGRRLHRLQVREAAAQSQREAAAQPAEHAG